MTSIGGILTARGLLTDDELAHAIAMQTTSGGRLGDIIVAKGMLGYLPLYHALAEHFSLPFVNILQEPHEHLLRHEEVGEYLKFRALPWKIDNGKTIIATSEYSDATRAWAHEKFGDEITFAITSPLDIRKTIERVFGAVLEEKSRLQLWQDTPDASARHTLSTKALRIFLLACALTLMAIIHWPLKAAMFLMAFCSVSYGATMLIKAYIFAEGTKAKIQPDWKKLLPALDEKTLPIYTILIPMYREAESLKGMLAAMSRMDYPADKLDIKLLLEADDKETFEAALALKPSHQFEILRVPPNALRTKPKACNYGLGFARGEYVTIYDADDRPDPQQLKKAIAQFRSVPPDVICLQARLNYYNASENLLTRFFALEYAVLFEVLLYGLQRLGIPLPLGGTSNHISMSRLRALGEWDPYNVTEDADLGIRISARGYRTMMLDSLTMEEAPAKVLPWIRQRSRWMKGYMQTWLVHMRDPLELYRTLGLLSFFGFQFFVGFTTFTFLTGPLVWLLAIGWSIFPPHLPADWMPTWLIWLTAINVMANLSTHWYMMIYTVKHHTTPSLANKITAFGYPLYLFLHSIASYKALWQLVVKPHFWEKTVHGLAPKFEQMVNSEHFPEKP